MVKKLLLTAVAAMATLLALPTPVQACGGGCGCGPNGYCGNGPGFCGNGCGNFGPGCGCDGGCGQNYSPCCCWDPCCGGPLCCGDFSLLVRGGVDPAVLTHRGQSYLITTAGVALPFQKIPSFSKMFHVPWTVGAELAWNASERVQFFLEYAFMQASGKKNHVISQSAVAGVTFTEDWKHFRANSGWVGVRYYFDNLCCSSCFGPLAPYVGFKAGFSWQQHVKRTIAAAGVTILPLQSFLINQTAISGGLQIGLEWWFCSCWSLQLQGEFIATQGPRAKTVLPVTLGGFTNLVSAHTGWVATFPVTLGLRWTF